MKATETANEECPSGEVSRKSIANQTVEELGGATSLLTRQRADHIKLDDLLRRLDVAPATKHRPILLEINRLVFPHAYAEEIVLWPVIRRVLPDGHQLTLRVEMEHQAINELVTRLDALELGSPEYHETLVQVVRLLRQDVRDEEDELLAGLQARLSHTQLRRLGLAWEAVRRISPTRAHPAVSRRPPGNMLSALPLTVLDRACDRIDAFVYSGAGPAQKPMAGLGSGLRALSRGAEHLPGLGSGEHPATRRRGNSARWWGIAAIAAAAAGVAWLVTTKGSRARRAAAGGPLSRPGR